MDGLVDLGKLAFRVEKETNVSICLDDGCRLAATVWLPKSWDEADAGPFTAVLEYLPYQKVYWTAIRDEAHLPYFAGCGYAVVRVDMRGSGNSEGLYFDEYAEQEQSDCLQVIDWIASQKWCNGKVVMYGKSWGGFNGLQMAALNPPALKGVISAYSTDDRYADDIHFMGGCLLSIQHLPWSSQMFLWNARPPHPGPGHGGIDNTEDKNNWRCNWIKRLENIQPWIETWMSPPLQLRNHYWKHGSVCEDFSKLKCPMLLVGGFFDGYTDPVFRMLKHVDTCNVNGIVGPWGHNWPESAYPGPRIGSMQLFVHWMKSFVDDVSDQVELQKNWSKLSVYRFASSFKPDAHTSFAPGTWTNYDSIDYAVCSEETDTDNVATFLLSGDNTLVERRAHIHSTVLSYSTDLRVGRNSGDWLGWGYDGDGELPDEQTQDDALSLTFDFSSNQLGGSSVVYLTGCPRVTLNIPFSTSSRLHLMARLCKVDRKTGKSFLLCRGALNLNHEKNHSATKEFAKHESRNGFVVGNVSFLLQACYADVDMSVYALRLSLSNSYWPFLWPSPTNSTFEISPGGDSTLTLPVDKVASSRPRPTLEEPIICKGLEGLETMSPATSKRAFSDVVSSTSGGKHELSYCFSTSSGRSRYADGTECEEAMTTRFDIVEGDPLSAQCHVQGTSSLKFGELLETSIATHSVMTCDKLNFYLHNSVKVVANSAVLFFREFRKTVPRVAL
mmetsp:Transcript_15137/g.24595  ORF Transcript_15137/g.24595 Transcript_15137/m.24595 type:complete len:726 (+) Transcript_15137:171-2348(+)